MRSFRTFEKYFFQLGFGLLLLLLWYFTSDGLAGTWEWLLDEDPPGHLGLSFFYYATLVGGLGLTTIGLVGLLVWLFGKGRS